MTVATLITDWRQAVVSHLGTRLAELADELEIDMSFEVVSGEREGVNRRDEAVVAVWWPGWDEIARDTILQQPSLNLRYFPPRSKAPSTSAPADPAPLEQGAGLLLAAFPRSTQRTGFFTDGIACRLTGVRPDYRADRWYVGGTLLAYTALEGA